jgi:L-arabinokinase
MYLQYTPVHNILLRMSDIHRNSRVICYYVTGHGFGHATRVLGLVQRLLQEVDTVVHIISSLDQRFFYESISSYENSFKDRLFVINRCLDAGAVQINPLLMDVERTLIGYYETVHVHHERLVSEEVQFLKECNSNLVLVDASALACKAAKLASVKSIIISNFTWDSIYIPMLEHLKSSNLALTYDYDAMIRLMQDDYASADCYLQLPGEMPVPSFFTGQVIPAPLISRKPKSQSREEILAKYGIPNTTKKIIIFGFGGQRVSELSLNDEMLPTDFICLVLQAEESQFRSDKFFALPRDVHVPDLLALAEVMLGKIGYGTCSECLAVGTPLICVTRELWPEEKPLKELMTRFNSVVEMPRADFDTGNWVEYVERASEMKRQGWDISELRSETAVEEIFSIALQYCCDDHIEN